jgi:putative tryptophan/tyrosine transport system substrate-binding protein
MKPTSKWLSSIGTVAAGVFSFVLPLAAMAQPAAKVHRIGVLGHVDLPPWEGLRQGLRELGYIDGRNVTIEWRWSGGFMERLPALATELVDQKVDVIVTSGGQGGRAAKQATSTIPIVVVAAAYPDKVGLVDSLARPGGNVSGVSSIAFELMAKRLELLKEIAPATSRVAFLFNPTNLVEPLSLREVQAAARVANIEILPVELTSPEGFPAAFAAMSRLRPDALMVNGNPINFKGAQLITDFALKNRLPAIYEERTFVEGGGLISYASSFFELFRRAATYVDKILKGARPADLPVEQPTKFELVINKRTAQALGLTIPPALLLRADQIIE